MNEDKRFQMRLLQEYRGLVERRIILERFLESNQPVDSKQKELLNKQYEVMLQYEQILFERIFDMMK